jgi:hypothetical protein
MINTARLDHGQCYTPIAVLERRVAIDSFASHS